MFVDSLRILPEVIDEIIAREERELKRRELAHRGHEVSPQIRQNRLPKPRNAGWRRFASL
jgi:predicted phosphoribosyltransferase